MASAEEAHIADELVAGLVAAWNQHDMTAFARMFHDDAAFVNVLGRSMHGRTEIEQHHTASHAGPFKNSALTACVEDARSVGPDVIIAHVRSELKGDDRMPGQARTAMMTVVFERRASASKIIAAHNTNIGLLPM